jgi:hypothetical protein
MMQAKLLCWIDLRAIISGCNAHPIYPNGLSADDDRAGLRESLKDRLDFMRAELLLHSMGSIFSLSENTN